MMAWAKHSSPMKIAFEDLYEGYDRGELVQKEGE
jgi:hypothetical protein